MIYIFLAIHWYFLNINVSNSEYKMGEQVMKTCNKVGNHAVSDVALIGENMFFNRVLKLGL